MRKEMIVSRVVAVLAAILVVCTVEGCEEEEAAISSKSSEYTTPLHDAAATGNLVEVKRLIERGSNVNNRNIVGGWTPLHQTVYFGHEDVVELLISNGADITIKDGNGKTVLHHVIYVKMRKEIRAIIKLLIASGANVNTKDNRGNSPLHDIEDLDIAELLISKGAAVNAENEKGMSPLHYASIMGRTNIAHLLISKRAKIDIKAEGGVTPLHCAVMTGEKDIARLLISKRANVNAKTDFDMTPLHLAICRFSKLLGQLPSFFMYGGIAMGRLDVPASTIEDHYDVARLLISKGANVNARNKNGLTPLHYVGVIEDNTDIAELLIANGANVNVKDKKGMTPLRIAVLLGRKNLEKVLKRHGGHL